MKLFAHQRYKMDLTLIRHTHEKHYSTVMPYPIFSRRQVRIQKQKMRMKPLRA